MAAQFVRVKLLEMHIISSPSAGFTGADKFELFAAANGPPILVYIDAAFCMGSLNGKKPQQQKQYQPCENRSHSARIIELPKHVNPFDFLLLCDFAQRSGGLPQLTCAAILRSQQLSVSAPFSTNPRLDALVY